MESNEQNKLTNNRKRITDTKNSLTAVGRGQVGALGEKGEGCEQRGKLTDTDSMVITRGKGIGGT